MDDSVRAVVPIHYSGIACDIEGICSVLDQWPRAELIEDNAHGLFGRYGRPLGSFGRFATLSFHETKNFICGEGGALIVNDEADLARAHVVYHKGTNRRAFLHGDVDKYSWQDVGSSFGLADVLAAFLYGQLEERDTILGSGGARSSGTRSCSSRRPSTTDTGSPSCPTIASRATTCSSCSCPTPTRATGRSRRCTSAASTPRSTTSPCTAPTAGDASRRETACPVTDDISGRLLRLPFYTDLTDADAERVVDELLATLRS